MESCLLLIAGFTNPLKNGRIKERTVEKIIKMNKKRILKIFYYFYVTLFVISLIFLLLIGWRLVSLGCCDYIESFVPFPESRGFEDGIPCSCIATTHTHYPEFLILGGIIVLVSTFLVHQKIRKKIDAREPIEISSQFITFNIVLSLILLSIILVFALCLLAAFISTYI